MGEAIGTARTNRNNRELIAAEENRENVLKYRAAIYARLSVEDNGTDGEAMETQLSFLRRYVSGREELELTAEYCDNGRTGTNFDRPGFGAMMEDAGRGKINCIVVKDLSRFGRNYIETGNYIETVFPAMGVRFLSVNDEYDSRNPTSNEELALSLKNIYHQMYAVDISCKISTLLAVKKKKGLFLGNFAPYGYQKAEHNRYRLEMDEESAAVVRDIFACRLEGMGAAQIARFLNDSGISSPYRRLYEKGLLKGKRGEADALWSASSVQGILDNPVYCGCMVEQKGRTDCGGSAKRVKIPKENWNYIENTHPAIIDKAVFCQAQKKTEERAPNAVTAARTAFPPMRSDAAMENAAGQKQEREKSENCLRGLIVCGSCGRAMTRDAGYYGKDGRLIRHRFICSGKYRKKGGCTASSVLEEELLGAVAESLKIQVLVLDGKENRLSGGEKWLTGQLCRKLLKKLVVYEKKMEIHYTFCSGWNPQKGEGK